MKKILLILIIFTISACGSSNEALCKKEECLNLIELDIKLDAATEIIGIESSKEDYIYTYNLDKENSLIIESYTGLVTKVSFEYNVNDYKNEEVLLDDILLVIEELNNGEVITHEEFKKTIGDVDGLLVYKDAYDYKYLWVDDEGRYVEVLMNADDNLVGITGEF